MKFALCRSDIDACDLRLEGVETVWEVPKDKLCLSGGRGLTLESIETYGTVPSESTPFYGKDTVQTTNRTSELAEALNCGDVKSGGESRSGKKIRRRKPYGFDSRLRYHIRRLYA